MYTYGMDEQFTLEELAQKTGIEARTIRNYIQRGLLRGPEALGRKAFYVSYHLRRLEAIKLLKEFYGLQLREIRQVLLSQGEGDFDPAKMDLKPVARDDAGAPREQDTALDFIRSVKQQCWTPDTLNQRRWMPDPGSSPAPEMEREAVPLEQLLRALRNALGDRTTRRATRGEPWMHMEVTPDITLMARGKYTTEELAILEQVADCMRQILLGGTDNVEW